MQSRVHAPPISPRQKWVRTEEVGIEILGSKEVSPHALKGPVCFFLGRRGERLFSQCVPIRFLLGSQYVPNSTLLYPISFAFSSDLVTEITRSKQGHYSIHALGTSHLLQFLGFCDGPITDANHKKNKMELWGYPQPGTLPTWVTLSYREYSLGSVTKIFEDPVWSPSYLCFSL